MLEERREQRGLLLGIRHVGRDREDRVGARVHRQKRAVRVLDDAAPRGELDRTFLLPSGAALELVPPEHLQVHEPHEKNEDPETDPREQEKGPAVRTRCGAQGRAFPGAGAGGWARDVSFTRRT